MPLNHWIMKQYIIVGDKFIRMCDISRCYYDLIRSHRNYPIGKNVLSMQKLNKQQYFSTHMQKYKRKKVIGYMAGALHCICWIVDFLKWVSYANFGNFLNVSIRRLILSIQYSISYGVIHKPRGQLRGGVGGWPNNHLIT